MAVGRGCRRECMDANSASQLDWIHSQHERMAGLVAEWAGINSGSLHLEGLERCTAAVVREFAALGGEVRWIDLPGQPHLIDSGELVDRPLGRAVHIAKRPAAARRVLLAIHVDTVYGPNDPFQRVSLLDRNTLRGPGVVDAKGGLAVMLVAIEAFERSAAAAEIAWDVVINPDEELGSPRSRPLLAAPAGQHGLS